MVETSKYILRPNRLTVVPLSKKSTMDSILDKQIQKHYQAVSKERYESNFSKPKNNLILSKTTRRKIFDRVNTLYTLSPSRRIEMRNGKTLYNFRASFITLTLPSPQQHTDVEIKSKCLNQFLVELRKHYGFNNYIWKAELQKNENIHFHLVSDTYLDYQALRRRWNRCLEKLGYVSAYRDKMSELSFKDYCKLRNAQSNEDIQSAASAFTAGNRSKWSNPNSVDVRSVKNNRDLASYIAKYIAKEIKTEEMDEATEARGLSFGRVWACSQSLNLPMFSGSIPRDMFKKLVEYFQKIPDKVKHYAGDFFSVYYFNIDTFTVETRNLFLDFFRKGAAFYSYPLIRAT